MRLHENKQLFADAINAASRPKNDGGLGIKSIFIELTPIYKVKISKQT